MKKIVLLVMLAAGCQRGSGFAHPELIVSAEWLRAHADDPALRLVDARPRADYEQGHLPGAVSLPVAETFDPAHPKNLPASRAVLAQLFGARGIGTDRRVVVYDGGKQTPAPRLFWTLEWAGHPDVAVLDGGMAAWKTAGGTVTADEPKLAAEHFGGIAASDRLAERARCAAAIGRPGAVILDARSTKEYSGAEARARFGGHIPGAVNVDWGENFAPDGRLRSPATLRALYAGRGIAPDKEVITHCQSGQRSSASYWTLRLLGYERVGNYAASWADWGNDPETPKETNSL